MKKTAAMIMAVMMAVMSLTACGEAKTEGTTIAMDGIAVIVNKDCPVEEMTSESVRAIYTGEITDWSEVQ